MKEIIAIIRMNKVNQTKSSLALEGFPAFTCLRVFGRGKKEVKYEVIDELSVVRGEVHPMIAEAASEGHRLLPKRMISVTVPDADAEKVIKAIIAVNKTGHPGDGKIFVLPMGEAYRVRTGETGDQAIQ